MPRSFLGVCTLFLLIRLALPVGGGYAQDIDELNRDVRTAELLLARGGLDPLARARLAWAYLSRARVLGDWTDIDRAEQILVKASSLDPEHPDLLLAGANLHLFQHEFQESLAAAERLLRLRPADPRGYGAATDALLELGRLAEAKEMADKMVAMQRDFDSLHRLARIRDAFGKTETAVALMGEAISSVAEDDATAQRRAWGRVMVASFQMNRGRLSEAEELLQAVLVEQPDYDFALEHLGEINGLLGKDKEADRAYARAFSVRPEPAYAVAWAEVKRRLGQNAMADTLDQVAERALRSHVEAGRVAYLRELATLYLRRKKKPKVALRLAIQDTTLRQDTKALETLAWALQQNGQHKAARRMIQRALARPDADAMTAYRAATIALDVGEYNRARELLRRSLEINPHFGRPEVEHARALLKKLRQRGVAN